MTDEQPHEQTSEVSGEERSMPVVRQLAVLGLILLAIFSVSVIPKTLQNLTARASEQNADVTETEQLNEYTTPDLRPFDNIAITGGAAFVWDINTQRVLYEKNPDAQLPIASITKLMTALVAYEILAENEQVVVSDQAVRQEGNSGFAPGEIFTFETLADITLMSSSNDGAYAIAATAGALLDTERPAHTFVEAMNVRAKELGLTQTYFRNPTGLDISETESGAYSSVRDVTFLMEYILEQYPEILETTSISYNTFASEAGDAHDARNTNEALSRLPNVLGSKTGYTTLSGGNLAVAFDAGVNRPVIVVVLGSTYTERFNDVVTLTNATKEALQ